MNEMKVEFDMARKENKERVVNWDTEWSEEQEEMEEAESEIYKRPKRLRAGAEVRGQSAFAFCVIPDPSENGEVVINVLGAFETTAEANAWASESGTQNIMGHDIMIGSTCDWIYPNGTKTKSNVDTYRLKELQGIMDYANKNPKRVQSFKKWKAEQDRKTEERISKMKSEESKNPNSEESDHSAS